MVGVAAALGGLLAAPAWAGYNQYGLGMDIQTGTVSNGALNVQTVNRLWNNTTPGANDQSPNTYSHSFDGITCDDYAAAWLVTTVYGGSALNTARITATVNGHTIASPVVGNAGGVYDTNPNVYGSSTAGVWVLSIPVSPSYLNTNGATNDVSVTVSDKTKGATSYFDGRSYYQALVTVSQTAGLNNTLSYAFAAGGGDIGTGTGYLNSRTLDMGGIGSRTVTRARAHAIYAYGDYGQADQLLLNGVSLAGNDAANHNNNDTSVNYPADILDVDAMSGLALSGNNQLTFSTTGESSLRPELAILEVTQTPEPATLGLVALGVFGLLRRSRGSA